MFLKHHPICPIIGQLGWYMLIMWFNLPYLNVSLDERLSNENLEEGALIPNVLDASPNPHNDLAAWLVYAHNIGHSGLY